jgi:prevent-host-death family protein
MTTVTVHEAKTQLSRILAAVESGEEFTIARRDKPIAKLVPITPEKPRKRVPGLWKGQFTLPDSAFDPMSEEELAEWYDGKL